MVQYCNDSFFTLGVHGPVWQKEKSIGQLQFSVISVMLGEVQGTGKGRKSRKAFWNAPESWKISSHHLEMQVKKITGALNVGEDIWSMRWRRENNGTELNGLYLLKEHWDLLKAQHKALWVGMTENGKASIFSALLRYNWQNHQIYKVYNVIIWYMYTLWKNSYHWLNWYTHHLT